MDLRRDTIPAHSTLRLDGRPGSAAGARAHASDFLAGSCDPPLRSDQVTDALILISELVNNAVRHAPGPCALDIVHDGTTLVIAVSDTGADMPRTRLGDLRHGTGGFGWNLLNSLAKDIRVTGYRAGWKTVIATLAAAQA